MHISWLGQNTVKLQVKPVAEDITIVINPYRPEQGNFPRSLTPNIALLGDSSQEPITLSGDPFILDTPGEVETHGVLLTALYGNSEHDLMYRIDAEHMTVAHLGMLSQVPDDRQLEVLNGTDIVLISVGGEGYGLTPEQAAKTVNYIEPRIIIPIFTQSDNSPKAAAVSEFIKEIGIKPDEEGNKVIIKKKDLPQEDMQLILLEKE